MYSVIKYDISRLNLKAVLGEFDKFGLQLKRQKKPVGTTPIFIVFMLKS